jgi:hypothetical protein
MTEQFFKQSSEFMQKSAEMFFGAFAQPASTDATQDLSQWWNEHIQTVLKNAAKANDPVFLGQFLQKSFQNSMLYMNMMNAALQSMREIPGERSGKEQIFEAFEQSTQQAWDWYQENIEKYLHAAQLGVERENLMKIMVAIDAYNQFLKEMWDFSKRFNIPFQEGVEKFQRLLQEQENEEPVKNTKELYNFLIGILTKQYDAFLKSPEGVNAVTLVLDKYIEYRQRLNAVIEIWCKSFSLPTKT